MPFNSVIGSTVAVASIGAYAIYKMMNKRKELYPPFQYKVSEHEEYTITNPAFVYKHTVETGSFSELERAYKSDLFGNYKKKEHIDKLLKEYLEKKSFTQKHLVINTEGYVADININANTENKTLVFDLENNSLFEASIDGKYGK